MPRWDFVDEVGVSLNTAMFDLLLALQTEGRLTAAAKQVGISYRHAWNQLKQWEAYFGLPLVTLHKGKGAWLTPLGEKLLWAQQRVRAQLEPELENIASDINLHIQTELAGDKPLLNVFASHGYAVALLPEHLKDLKFKLRFTSAEDALRSLSQGECELAGFHMPDASNGVEKIPAIKRYLNEDYGVIRFIRRTQGLIVGKNNPKNIKTLADLTQANVRFVNRQSSSGTRHLLDQLLLAQGVDRAAISGYTNEEFTHSAVAAYVAAGMADAGFAVGQAATQFGLDFVPLCPEQYLFACRKSQLDQPLIKRFIDQIKNPEFIASVLELSGYEPDCCGELLEYWQL